MTRAIPDARMPDMATMALYHYVMQNYTLIYIFFKVSHRLKVIAIETVALKLTKLFSFHCTSSCQSFSL